MSAIEKNTGERKRPVLDFIGCIPTYVRALHVNRNRRHTYRHPPTHTYIPAHMHAYINAYIHTYLHMCMHT